MTETTDIRPELILSIEMMMNRSFEGVGFSGIVDAMSARISELQGPASQEAEYDASSLERDILQGLMGRLLGVDIPLGAAQPAMRVQ
jgi:hypothetical protein